MIFFKENNETDEFLKKFDFWTSKFQKKSSLPVAFLRIFWGIYLANFIPNLKNVCFFCYKYFDLKLKIPLLNKIHPFDNTEKVYQSISGDTFENWLSEKPD